MLISFRSARAHSRKIGYVHLPPRQRRLQFASSHPGGIGQPPPPTVLLTPGNLPISEYIARHVSGAEFSPLIHVIDSHPGLHLGTRRPQPSARVRDRQASAEASGDFSMQFMPEAIHPRLQPPLPSADSYRRASLYLHGLR